MAGKNLQERLRIAGVLLISGLGIEGVCLLWARPLAFIVMVALGGLLCFAGVAVYLVSLVSTGRN